MKASTALLVIGVLLIFGGILALANPLAASIAVTTLVGAMFLASGVLQAWFLFRDPGAQHRLWNGLVALLTIVAGVWLLTNPLEGTVSLTLILGVVFLIMGVMRLLISSRLSGTPFFWLMLLSGLASVAIGLLVFTDFQSAATSLLGILLGIQLLAEGAGLAAIGLFSRRLDR
ncbi:HdeD family acid-resistance protein [Seohaeicola nanhaiensis]|uniref:HdeD family acid-resistance protein n=1 Tax=Seohaeicola nanhaiensis TaxID=1387282 RepID=A0ABV9KGF1_9RHOB